MARHNLACVVALIALSTAAEQARWSRQISSYTSDLSDWVPLPGPIEREETPILPIKRQAVAEPRILAEPVFPGFQRPTGFSQDFPARTYFNHNAANRQLYLQSVPSVPSAPQNYLSDQGFSQGFRFGLAQPNYPLNQAFVSPQLNFDSAPPPPVINQRQKVAFISNPIAFRKTNLPSPQEKPLYQQPQNVDAQKTVDGYRIEGITNFHSMKKPQVMKKLKYETHDKIPKTEMIPPRAKSEKEEVQLLYVPLESLNKGQFNHLRTPIAAPQTIKPTNFNNQNIQRPLPSSPALPKQNFAESPFHLPKESYEMEFFSDFNKQYKELDQTAKFSTISTPYPTTLRTTPKPKKLKPHQPPLAIFLAHDVKKGNQVKVGDVLSSLKNADTVAVLDSVNPQTAPRVFIGPSNLAPPENFARFELPYLSNIEHSDKKLRQLPFFVAPLSYKTPQGFAKIPFPSPHVGSVVINSQIKDSATQPSPTADVIPNSYTTSSQTNVRYRQQHPYTPTESQKVVQPQEQKPVTQTPSVSFFTTSPPKTNAPINHQSNYYSFEPQTVSTVRTPKEPQATIATGPPKQPGSYFLSNLQFQSQEVPSPNVDLRDFFESGHAEPAQQYIPTQPSTSRTTVSSTTAKPSTYPNQLLETHNPYSINQAFHFSTPLDYHNLFEENYATPGPGFPQKTIQREHQPSSVATPSSTLNSTPKPVEPVTDKIYQTSPNYLQNNYSPEIHHESELTNTRYQGYNNEYSTKFEANEYVTSSKPSDDPAIIEAQPLPMDHLEPINNTPAESDAASKSPYYQYETNYEVSKETSPSSSTTTTTTRKTPIRNRGRPRYTTPKADSNESTSRTVVTRKPLRERRPLPTRARYEPNKISTERSTRKPVDSSESTTKYTRSRTRGRVQYKPTESEDYYKSSKISSSKENDLAYQRDVLHQNYPVTIMERSSTHDIEAITEPLPRISSTKLLEPVTEVYDTEHAYSYDRAAVSQHIPASNSKEAYFTSDSETQTETNSKFFSIKDDYSYPSRSSLASGSDGFYQFNESPEKTENFGKQTTESLNSEVTNPTVSLTEQSPSSYSISDISSKTEEVPTTPDQEITKLSSYETTPQEEPEENIVQTTPSYNRVRVRPGVVRQYHQASSTESPRAKTRRPAQPVTYRPAFDRRRTTMRIEEIEADLKTKPLHSRPEQDYRHPVYRPEPTTEPSVTASYSQEATTKRGTFRRRRPVYSSSATSSTEASSSSVTTKRTYELKNRFKGRRPTTEKATTEKLEIQTDVPNTTRGTLYNRYTRPRLSERFNKKPESEDSEDQESNYSINISKYVEAENDQWSPKISTDSFRPYNPNEIADDKKATTTSPYHNDDEDIITARNKDYDDILLTVTPASNNNNRINKKIPDIPPTLEALVEQSKTTSASADKMSTFETMLEQVMKSLDEQDEHEYTKNVMKHKGGEIGEIPPERIISSGDNIKSTTVMEKEVTTEMTTSDDLTHKEDEENKTRRRGFWKKVKRVRPTTTESIEAAESQYYTNTVNRLGESVEDKTVHHKLSPYKPRVTTYKPAFQFLQNVFGDSEDDVFPSAQFINFLKTENKTADNKNSTELETKTTESNTQQTVVSDAPTTTTSETSQFPKIDDPYDTSKTIQFTKNYDSFDISTSTSTELTNETTKKVDKFSFMDYLFGTTAEDESQVELGSKTVEPADFGPETTEKYQQNLQKSNDIQITTETSKPRLPTTESTYFPEEITESGDEKGQTTTVGFESKKVNGKEDVEDTKLSERTKIETSSASSYMDPKNVVSTSMSTEISHETEICFRGKCVKNIKDIFEN